MNSKIIALFPGQGSQFPGMGKSLYQEFSLVRSTFEEASEALQLDVKKICFNQSSEELSQTKNTQACLLTVSVATFRLAEKLFGLEIKAAAGHSLGEYSALVANKSLSLSTAVRLVRKRGIAMQAAVPQGVGGMTALLGLKEEEVEKLCQEASELLRKKIGQKKELVCLEPSNFNCPGQIVVSGSLNALACLEALVKTQREGPNPAAKAIRLEVSAPFHCSLMRTAREEMDQVFSRLTDDEKPKKGEFFYIPNRLPTVFLENPEIILTLLSEQIDHPVLWSQSMQFALENEFNLAIEFGPGKVLCGLMKRASIAVKKSCTNFALGELADLKKIEDAKEFT